MTTTTTTRTRELRVYRETVTVRTVHESRPPQPIDNRGEARPIVPARPRVIVPFRRTGSER